jgi:CheY-like chemotaxis protein
MSPATALIVDDSPEIRRLFKRSLADLQFETVEASNGEDAVRLARQCQPSVILLDLCMPGMDGWEVVSCLRSDPALEDVPIIVITAYYGSSIVQAVQRAGCQYVVAKPFDLKEILRIITALTSSTNARQAYYV